MSSIEEVKSAMRTYVGTRTVRAMPLTLGDYNRIRGWQIPADENHADEGYLVEYLDGGPSNQTEFENYISWSPKDVFDRAYKDVTVHSTDEGDAPDEITLARNALSELALGHLSIPDGIRRLNLVALRAIAQALAGHGNFNSRFGIGDEVRVASGPCSPSFLAKVVGVTFTSGKVKYDVVVNLSTFSGVDSALVHPKE
jgi:hypothetical protein